MADPIIGDTSERKTDNQRGRLAEWGRGRYRWSASSLLGFLPRRNTKYHQQHSPGRPILAKNISLKNSPRRSRVYVVRMPLCPSMFVGPHLCLRSSVNCQQHAHPSRAPSHRHRGNRTTGSTPLSHVRHAVGVKPPTHAHHDPTPAEYRAHPGGSVGPAVINATEYHHGS